MHAQCMPRPRAQCSLPAPARPPEGLPAASRPAMAPRGRRAPREGGSRGSGRSRTPAGAGEDPASRPPPGAPD
eukprot:7988743-Lingulodinium_polyedra.AAC.1